MPDSVNCKSTGCGRKATNLYTGYCKLHMSKRTKLLLMYQDKDDHNAVKAKLNDIKIGSFEKEELEKDAVSRKSPRLCKDCQRPLKPNRYYWCMYCRPVIEDFDQNIMYIA